MNAPEAWNVFPALTKLRDCWAANETLLPIFCGTTPGVSCSRSKKLPRPSGMFSHQLRRYTARHFGGGGVDQFGAGRGNRDLLGGRAEFEFDIEVSGLRGLDRAVGNWCRFKSFGGDGDGVSAAR